MAKEMFGCQYHEPHFKVSFLDLLVHGVDSEGRVSVDSDLARGIAAANGALGGWEGTIGFGAAEASFIRSFGIRLMGKGLAQACDRDSSQLISALLSPLGMELIDCLAALSPGLLEASGMAERARRVLALRRHLFRMEIELGEREAARERSKREFGAALGWAYRVLRLDPDSVVAREVADAASDLPSPLPQVDCDRWLPAVEAVDGWLSAAEATALARCVAAAPSDRATDVVEIGSYKGRSTVAIALAISELGLPLRLTAMDPHAGYRFGDDVDTYAALCANLRRNRVEGTVSVLRASSTEVWLGAPVAFAFVDGLHDPESVRADHAHVAPCLVEGGLLAFHDYSEHYPGILDLVDELLATPGYEFVACADSLVVLKQVSP